ncbi:photosystem II complex extrinsic protein PsbU [Waterburya agarophytonicola K14]|uniref:Photosystem II complex extrinsic protein PsbU n=1 Tax=Waterburya agarophytonicola KI4 TaxID=2874699 RepID=A0A964FHT6_9CYAN|nr:photosystem II complex extrinsic protein PsbU [Waterburya agarophytonicola]MCC0179411.1 photosystem II complex extrinsic protein PsbU [Waterburya agarophytonicola KI4]
MKRFVGIITALLLIVGSLSFAGTAQASEMGVFNVQSPTIIARINTADAKRKELVKGKLDLNNSDVREFRKLPGFYPGLASKIIQNAPYNDVQDVLDIPGLSSSQLERLQANLDEFFITDVEASMNAGGDRYNPGLY